MPRRSRNQGLTAEQPRCVALGTERARAEPGLPHRAGNGICPSRGGSRSICGTGPREPGNAWAAPSWRRLRLSQREPAALRVSGRVGPSGLGSLGPPAELNRGPRWWAQPAELRGR
nr:uncharacterized protein LOC104652237 [Saimiri boliviensis boliviensis]